jgi:DNA-binding transcriptional ArsR family regulator
MSDLQEILELDTIEEFDALMSANRLELAEILATPKTAKEAAEDLGVPVTRLYYHLNALLDTGLVKVVDERPKGALKERVFQVTAKTIRPSRSFLETYGSDGMAEVSAMAFRRAETRFAAALKAGLIGAETDERSATLGLVNLRLSTARLHELVGRLEKLQEEFAGDDGEQSVSFFHATHPRKEQS